MMMVIGIIGSSGGLYAEERVLPVQSLPGSAGAVALCGDGTFLYLAGSGKFQVWKIADHPEKPRRIAELTGLPSWECRQIIVHRGYAYITARNRGLWIVDVRNPERPRKVGSFDTAELATGVDALGDVAERRQRVTTLGKAVQGHRQDGPPRFHGFFFRSAHDSGFRIKMPRIIQTFQKVCKPFSGLLPPCCAPLCTPARGADAPRRTENGEQRMENREQSVQARSAKPSTATERPCGATGETSERTQASKLLNFQTSNLALHRSALWASLPCLSLAILAFRQNTKVCMGNYRLWA